MLFNAGEDAEVFQHLAAENAFPLFKLRFMKPTSKRVSTSEILPSWNENLNEVREWLLTDKNPNVF